MGQSTSDQGSVRAVDRALDILEAFRPGESRLGVAELLPRLDLSRPTLYRLLRTLEQRGFVVSSGDPQRFSLGPAVARLSKAWSSGHEITELARPVMEKLWEDTGETVALMMLSGRERICVAELPSPQPLSFRRGLGHREPITLGASGRAILAFVQDPTPYLSALPPKRRQACLQELEHVRVTGCAVSREELIAGAVAMAAPIFLAGGEVVGSLVIYGPSVRIDDKQVQRILQRLLRASARISG
ncbi:MAG: hypothetical protein RI884_1311 [Pseudomonadota bacterium]